MTGWIAIYYPDTGAIDEVTQGDPAHVALDGRKVVRISPELVGQALLVVNGVAVVDIEAQRDELLAQVDNGREAARRPAMTQLFGQSFVYAEKAREVTDYRCVPANVLATLTLPARRARFPFAMAEAEATGDTLAVVITRFEAGASANRQVIAKVDATAIKAKRAIRAATTLTTMKAAAAVDWEN
jgi:hypothetical protein